MGALLAGWAVRLAGCCSGVLTDISIGIESVSFVGFSAAVEVLAFPGSAHLASEVSAVGAPAVGAAATVVTGADAELSAAGAALAAVGGGALAAGSEANGAGVEGAGLSMRNEKKVKKQTDYGRFFCAGCLKAMLRIRY